MEIKNFTSAETLDVVGHFHSSNTFKAPLVRMTQYGGSMSFQFSMTPEQARELADILNVEADRAEALAGAAA